MSSPRDHSHVNGYRHYGPSPLHYNLTTLRQECQRHLFGNGNAHEHCICNSWASVQPDLLCRETLSPPWSGLPYFVAGAMLALVSVMALFLNKEGFASHDDHDEEHI